MRAITPLHFLLLYTTINISFDLSIIPLEIRVSQLNCKSEWTIVIQNLTNKFEVELKLLKVLTIGLTCHIVIKREGERRKINILYTYPDIH